MHIKAVNARDIAWNAIKMLVPSMYLGAKSGRKMNAEMIPPRFPLYVV